MTDWLVRSLGGPGFGRDLRRRESDRRYAAARSRALQGYVDDAWNEWHRAHPAAPSWMLPVLGELAAPEQLAPGTAVRLDRPHVDSALASRRAGEQPPLTVGSARFPDSASLRSPSSFTILDLAGNDLEVFEKWFASPDSWKTYAVELAGITRRRLSAEGLVWRQHKIRPDLDGTDLRNAKPGTTLTLPYPVSCRSRPHPIGSIMRPLPRRSSLLARKVEKFVYLEIWATEGAALPGRPDTEQNEDEVLLPAGSVFDVVRHVDLPYVKEHSAAPAVLSAHGVQLVQRQPGRVVEWAASRA